MCGNLPFMILSLLSPGHRYQLTLADKTAVMGILPLSKEGPTIKTLESLQIHLREAESWLSVAKTDTCTRSPLFLRKTLGGVFPTDPSGCAHLEGRHVPERGRSVGSQGPVDGFLIEIHSHVGLPANLGLHNHSYMFCKIY